MNASGLVKTLGWMCFGFGNRGSVESKALETILNVNEHDINSRMGQLSLGMSVYDIKSMSWSLN